MKVKNQAYLKITGWYGLCFPLLFLWRKSPVGMGISSKCPANRKGREEKGREGKGGEGKEREGREGMGFCDEYIR